MLIHGNQAVVEGAIAAGCRFFAGYPITPATEIVEIMATRLPGQMKSPASVLSWVHHWQG